MPRSKVQSLARRLSGLLPMLLLALLIVTVFAPALTHDFAWDDHGLIVQNPAIRTTSNWAEPFLRSFWKIGANVEDSTRSFYRPLVSLSYMADYLAGGLNPSVYHATNLLLHILVSTLVYLLGLRWLGQRSIALLVAALFALHPSHVENVVWISGRTDMLCTLFYLAALLMLPAARAAAAPTGRRTAALCGFYLLALLGKEMALSLPILLAAYGAILPAEGAPRRRYIPFLLGSVGVTGFYLLLRIAILGHVVGPGMFGTRGERLLALPAVLGRYFGILVHVVGIDPHHAEPLHELTHAASVGIGALVLALCGALLAMLWRQGQKMEAFLVAWPVITLLPVLRLGVFGDILYADRFLYLPSVGFLMGMAMLWDRSRVVHAVPALRRVLGPTLALLYAAVSVALTVVHTRYWADNLRLFEHAARSSPRSAYIQYNLGNSRSAAGHHEMAVQAYLKALQLEPAYAQALANMGITLAHMERYVDATVCLRKALSLGDRSAVTYTSLGNAYRALGDLEQARRAYRDSLGVAETAAARNNLGECLLAEGQPGLAYEQFLRAYRLDATPRILSNLALSLIEQDRTDQAIPYLAAAYEQLADTPDAEAFAVNYNMARALHILHGAAAARPFARRAMDLLAHGHGPASSQGQSPPLLEAILAPDG